MKDSNHLPARSAIQLPALAWILQILVAGVLAASAIAKLAGAVESVMIFSNLGMEPGGRYLIGVIELIAALLLLVPFSANWGAILAWGVMTGALIAHLTKLGLAGTMLPMTLAAAFNWCGSAVILYLRRHQTVFIRCMFACKESDGSRE